MKEDSIHTVEGSVRQLEKEIGIRPGFLESLKTEDDWSFIIKLHALVEAAVSYLLCKALGHDELSETFSFLELSNKRVGKIAFVKSLGLLDEKDRRFISSLSELRNKLVHDISNVQFDLKEYVENLSPKRFETFVKSLDSFSYDRVKLIKAGKKYSVQGFFREHTKTAVWYSAMVTIGIIYQQKELALSKREIETLKKTVKLSSKAIK